MKKQYFITSTGTGIGKTYITCSLCKENKNFHAIKPIISGWDDNNDNDTVKILNTLNLPITEENVNKISPWRFKEPLSPDMAAAKEGCSLKLNQIVNYINQQLDLYENLLVEGVGGVMVPIDREHTIIDIIKEVSLPVILVTGSYLGTISHTLTAINALRNIKAKIYAVIINESENSPVSLEDTKSTLSNFIDEQIFVVKRGEGFKLQCF